MPTVNQVTVTVNGVEETRSVPTLRTLAEFLRSDLRLTGTHVACSQGICGNCTVFVDGEAVKSCLVLAVQADGCCVTTIEGLGSSDQLTPVQAAFIEHGAVQCGFCIPGMIMTATDFLAENPTPSEPEVRTALANNLCRCTGYNKIVEAVMSAASQDKEVKA